MDPAPLLERAGLSRVQVEDRDARLGVAKQIRFLNLADKALRDPLLGFNLAKTFDLQAMGLFYYVTASADTLGEGLMRAARYTSIANEAIFVRCQARHDFRVDISYQGVGRHTDRHQLEFCMTAGLSRAAWPLKGIALPRFSMHCVQISPRGISLNPACRSRRSPGCSVSVRRARSATPASAG